MIPLAGWKVHTIYSILDMQAGYWQVKDHEQDRAKTTFITADGMYEFKVIPFELINAPATFQRIVYLSLIHI